MKNRFYSFLIATALFAPRLHAMEDNAPKFRTIEIQIHPSFIYGGPIIPDVFTEKSKKFMQQEIDELMVGCEQDNVTTGLAGIYNSIKKLGVESLIQDYKNLRCANIFLGKMILHPLYAVTYDLEAMKKLNFDDAEGLRLDKDIYAALMKEFDFNLAAAEELHKDMCAMSGKDFTLAMAEELHKNNCTLLRKAVYINVFRKLCPEYKGSSEISIRRGNAKEVGVEARIEGLKRNEGLAVEANIPCIAAPLLVGAYFASLQEELAGASQS